MVTSPVISVSNATGAPRIESAQAKAVPVAVPVAYEVYLFLAELLTGATGAEALTAASVGTGIALAAGTGKNLIGAVDENQHALAEMNSVGELPLWSELTEEQQTAWGSWDNYNAYKWGLVLDVYGLGDCRDSLYTYVENGGDPADFQTSGSWDDSWTDTISNLGNTIQRIELGESVALGDIVQLITNPEAMFQVEGLGLIYQNDVVIDGVDLTFATVDFTAANSAGTINVNTTNWAVIQQRTGGVSYWVAYHPLNRDTIVFTLRSYNSHNYFTSVVGGYNAASLLREQYRTSAKPYFDVSSYPNDNFQPLFGNYFESNRSNWLNLLYEGTYSFPDGTIISNGVVPDTIEQNPDYGELEETPDAITHNIVNNYGDSIVNNIYPDRPAGQVPVVKKPQDVSQITNYTQIVQLGTPTEGGGGEGGGGEGGEGGGTTPENPFEPGDRPENPFNPDDQSGGEEFQENMDSELAPIWGLALDKLFPFCLIWDIGKLVEKVYAIGGYSSATVEAQSTSVRSLYADRSDLISQQQVNIRKLEAQDSGGSGGGDLPGPSDTDWFNENKPEWTAGHTEIVIPLVIASAGVNESVTIDVWPLAVILTWARPFFQIATIIALLFLSIQFFRKTIFSG